MSDDRYITVREARWHTALTAGLAFLAACILAAAQQVGSVEDQRRTCEGGNDGRTFELAQQDVLVQNALGRVANPATVQEGGAALGRALILRASLINSVRDPIAPGSIKRDCKEAFNKPWPFNWFEGDL